MNETIKSIFLLTPLTMGWIKPKLTDYEKERIEKASDKELQTMHNLGINGHPDFWNYVHAEMIKRGKIELTP